MTRNKSRLKSTLYSLATTLAAGLVVAAVVGTVLFLMSARMSPTTPVSEAGPPKAREDDPSRGVARDRLAKRRVRAPQQSDRIVLKEEEESPASGEDSSSTKMAGETPAPPTAAENPPEPAATQPKASKYAARTPAERRKAEERWRKKLDNLHLKGLHARGADAPAKRASAESALEAIDDPAAAGAIWRSFAGLHAHHLLAAQMLARLKSPESSKMLTVVSVFSDDDKARFAATNALRARDLGEFGENLISLIGMPLEFRRNHMDDPAQGRAEVLLVESEQACYQFVYPPTGKPQAPSGPSSVYGPGNRYMTAAEKALARQSNQLESERARAAVAAQIDSDIRVVKQQNDQIARVTERTVGVLRDLSGMTYGPRREPWRRWLASRLGYPYEPLPDLPKKSYTQLVPHAYEPSFISVPAPS
jgi:hypothetical protein